MLHRAISIVGLAAALAAAPISRASAREHFHHGHWHGPLGAIVGAGAAVVAGVVTIVALPFVALADATHPQYGRQRAYDQQGGFYGRARSHDDESDDDYAQPRGRYSADEGNGDGRARGYDAPQAGYHPVPENYYARQEGNPPPDGNYARQEAYPPRDNYYAPQGGYPPQGAYPPAQGYYGPPPQGYYGPPPPSYGPPPGE